MFNTLKPDSRLTITTKNSHFFLSSTLHATVVLPKVLHTEMCWWHSKHRIRAKGSGVIDFAIVDICDNDDLKHRQWIVLIDNGSIPNGGNGVTIAIVANVNRSIVANGDRSMSVANGDRSIVDNGDRQCMQLFQFQWCFSMSTISIFHDNNDDF